jgi:hypothetical protein
MWHDNKEFNCTPTLHYAALERNQNLTDRRQPTQEQQPQLHQQRQQKHIQKRERGKFCVPSDAVLVSAQARTEEHSRVFWFLCMHVAMDTTLNFGLFPNLNTHLASLILN